MLDYARRGVGGGASARPHAGLFDRARALLPQRCALCAAHAGPELLCVACEQALPRVGAACPTCALDTTDGRPCGACLARPPPFVETCAAFRYVFPVDRLLQNLKYGGQLAVAAWAAESLAAAIGNPLSVAVASTGRDADPAYPDAIVPLPLAASRQRERGFNQAHEIARVVARRLGLRIVTPLARVRAVAPQTSLPLADRVANVRGVFRCSETVRGRRIALVDDVMTTGATLAEAARTVQAAGATSVRCWVVARTPHSG